MTPQDPSPATCPDTEPLRCLWIEDEPEDVSAFLAELEDSEDGFGWSVDQPKTREEALASLKKTCYDVLIIDIMLPNDPSSAKREEVNVVAGLQILQELCKPTGTGASRLGGSRNIGALIVWTAVISVETKAAIEECLRPDDHPDAYLPKPVSDAQFQEVFQRVDRRLTQGTEGRQAAAES